MSYMTQRLNALKMLQRRIVKGDFQPGDRVRVNVGEKCAGVAGTVKDVSAKTGKVVIAHDGMEGDCTHAIDEVHKAHEFSKADIIMREVSDVARARVIKSVLAKAGIEVTTQDDPKYGVHAHQLGGQQIGHTVNAIGLGWTAVPANGNIKGKFKTHEEAKQYLADQHAEGMKAEGMAKAAGAKVKKADEETGDQQGSEAENMKKDDPGNATGSAEAASSEEDQDKKPANSSTTSTSTSSSNTSTTTAMTSEVEKSVVQKMADLTSLVGRLAK